MTIDTEVFDAWVAGPADKPTADPARAAWRAAPDSDPVLAPLNAWAKSYDGWHDRGARAAYATWRAAHPDTPDVPEVPAVVQGIYAYAQDIVSETQSRAALIAGAGVRHVRINNNPLTDRQRTVLADFDVMVTFSASYPQNFPQKVNGVAQPNTLDRDAWIAAYLTNLDGWMAANGHLVSSIEICNEPNNWPWPTDKAGKQRAYGWLLVAAGAHIRANWPDKTIVGFGAVGSSNAAPGFIRGVLAQNPAAATACDVVSFHPYVRPLSPRATVHEPWGSWSIAQATASIRALTDLPLWITEIGWQISKADGGRWDPPVANTCTPQQVGEYTVDLLALCAELGIARSYAMYVIDTDGGNWGWWTVGQAERPVVAAVRAALA